MVITVTMVILTIVGIINAILLDKAKCEIFILKKQVEDLDILRRGEEALNGTNSADIELAHLQSKADMLRFCYLCPLYQEKVQANKQQRTSMRRII